MSYRLTPELESKVINFINAGGYDWVAAEAAGIPRAVFERWLTLGERSRREPYRRFYQSVLKARAQARLKAEVDIRSKSARDWLRLGPGREQPDRPGWANPVRPQPARGDTISLLELPEFQAFAKWLLECAAAYPELRVKVAEGLEQFKS